MLPAALVTSRDYLREWLEFGSIMSALSGAVWLMYAFPAYRKKQEIADTPISRCDAVAVGKIAITGTAHADRPYLALFSGSSCTFCRCRISRWVSAGKSSGWREVATITSPPHPSFNLTDDAGTVVVLAENAELRLSPRIYVCGVLDPQESLFVDEILHANPHESESAAQSGLDILERYGSLSNHLYRVEEQRVDGGAKLYIYGSATEPAMLPEDIRRSADALPASGLVVWRGMEKSDFLISDQTQQNVISDLDMSALGIIGGPLLVALGVGVFAHFFLLSLPH